MKYNLAAEKFHLFHMSKGCLATSQGNIFPLSFFSAVLLSIVTAASGFPSLSASSVKIWEM